MISRFIPLPKEDNGVHAPYLSFPDVQPTTWLVLGGRICPTCWARRHHRKTLNKTQNVTGKSTVESRYPHGSVRLSCDWHLSPQRTRGSCCTNVVERKPSRIFSSREVGRKSRYPVQYSVLRIVNEVWYCTIVIIWKRLRIRSVKKSLVGQIACSTKNFGLEWKIIRSEGQRQQLTWTVEQQKCTELVLASLADCNWFLVLTCS